MTDPRDVPYAVQVGALIREELIQVLELQYAHALPLPTSIDDRELWERNGEAKVLAFLRHARQQFLEHSNNRALLNPS